MFSVRIFCLLISLLLAFGCAIARLSSLTLVFADLPSAGLRQTPILPTGNDSLLTGGRYAAYTQGNENYGMPGWTRNNGTRFHQGVDILPRLFTTSGQPKDPIYAILDGRVVVANSDPGRSGYGKYVMLEHTWADGRPFVSLYAHLASVGVRRGDRVAQGATIGIMGTTSRDPIGRRYLRAMPHCHFEVGRLIDSNFSLTRASRHLSPPNFSGNYDPRNVQRYNPVEFLKKYDAYRYRPVQQQAALTGLPNP